MKEDTGGAGIRNHRSTNAHSHESWHRRQSLPKRKNPDQ